MKDSIQDRLRHVAGRYEEVGLLLSQPEVYSDQNRYRELSQEYAQLEPLVKAWTGWQEARQALADAKLMLDESDSDLRSMAEEEIQTSKERKVEEWLPQLNVIAVAVSFSILLLAFSLNPGPGVLTEPATAMETGVVEQDRDQTTIPSQSILSTSHSSTRIVQSDSDYWSVTHTHPGEREIHVEATFDRPFLLSVRRDLVSIGPMVRPAVVNTLH